MLTSHARGARSTSSMLPEPVLDTHARARQAARTAEDLSDRAALDADRSGRRLERAASLLHGRRFDFSFSEVATALERSGGGRAGSLPPAPGAPSAQRDHAADPRQPARSGEIDAKHAQLISAFAAATQSGDLNALTQVLASDVRVVTDSGGKVAAGLNAHHRLGHVSKAPIAWRDSWLAPHVNVRVRGGATTSRRALPPSTAYLVSSWTHPRDRCRLRRSRLKAMSFGRYT
jgi:hypothetical protein